MTLECDGQQCRAWWAAGAGDGVGTSHLPVLTVEGDGVEHARSSTGRRDPAGSAGAAPARSQPGGRWVPAHSWRRKGAAGWRPGIFRSLSSLAAEMLERPGFICHSRAAALSRRRRVMSLRHRPMPSGQNATRSLETGEYPRAAPSAEHTARSTNINCLVAGAKRGSRVCVGERPGGELRGWHAVRAAPTCGLGDSGQVSVGLAGHRALMQLEATGHGCSEGSRAASLPAAPPGTVPCWDSQFFYKADWAQRAV